jgi:drug/metabolite transporter (DMT)-like permease
VQLNFPASRPIVLHPAIEFMAIPPVRVFLGLLNIFVWYAANGMNGVAMQQYAGNLRDANMSLPLAVVAALSVTYMQLVAGALLGFFILRVFYAVNLGALLERPWSHWMGFLHAAGSVFTNAGFLYGSASLVQVIKLLEPFQTLLWGRLLGSEDTNSLQYIASMSLVVGGAISLVRSRPNPPHPVAVLSAILSGCTLSLRNVLQRGQVVAAESYDGGSIVQTSVVQFTLLSFYASMWAVALAALLHGLFGILGLDVSVSAWYEHIQPSTIFWHPLYNMTSVTTLAFCSALTHSLLNAGKRIASIILAIVWFREGYSLDTVTGLVVVSIGGCWYTLDRKKGNGTKHKSAPLQESLVKIIGAVAILVLLYILPLAATIFDSMSIPVETPVEG